MHRGLPLGSQGVDGSNIGRRRVIAGVRGRKLLGNGGAGEVGEAAAAGVRKGLSGAREEEPPRSVGGLVSRLSLRASFCGINKKGFYDETPPTMPER